MSMMYQSPTILFIISTCRLVLLLKILTVLYLTPPSVSWQEQAIMHSNVALLSRQPAANQGAIKPDVFSQLHRDVGAPACAV